MDAHQVAQELRGALGRFYRETVVIGGTEGSVPTSSVDRLTNAVELVADRLAGPTLIAVPQHTLTSLTPADFPRMNGGVS